jgi:hypothetical protein
LHISSVELKRSFAAAAPESAYLFASRGSFEAFLTWGTIENSVVLS